MLSSETCLSCSANRSFRLSLISSMSNGRPVKVSAGYHPLEGALQLSLTLERIRWAMKERSVWRQIVYMALFRFLHQDRHARSRAQGGSTATVSPQPNRDFSRSSKPLDLLWGSDRRSESFAGRPSRRGIEGVKKLFLGAILVGEKLNVINQQCIHRAVVPLKITNRI